MPRFEFALSSSPASIRRAGSVTSDTWLEALELIAEQGEVEEGATLEIGVKGFPPARYQYIWSADDPIPVWQPVRLAA